MTFVPLNDLELSLSSAKAGQMPMQEFLPILLDADLAVPSAEEVLEDGNGFQPLLFPKEHAQMLACFTDKTRIGEFASLTPYCLVIKGRDLMTRLPAGYGLVLNPGIDTGLDISPDGVQKILSEFV